MDNLDAGSWGTPVLNSENATCCHNFPDAAIAPLRSCGAVLWSVEYHPAEKIKIWYRNSGSTPMLVYHNILFTSCTVYDIITYKRYRIERYLPQNTTNAIEPYNSAYIYTDNIDYATLMRRSVQIPQNRKILQCNDNLLISMSIANLTCSIGMG